MVHREEETYRRVAVAILIVNYLIYFTCYISFFNSFQQPDNCEAKDLSLEYSQNTSLPGAAAIVEKIIPIIFCQSQINRLYFTRISCVCEDDKIIDTIICFNHQIFQSIQLGTSIPFNCELQI